MTVNYKVLFSEKAAKEIKKLDKNTSLFILAWINKNLEGCENPRQKGKGLTSNRSGQWRYRIGNYRLIADISDEAITILILTIAHRKEVYDE